MKNYKNFINENLDTNLIDLINKCFKDKTLRPLTLLNKDDVMEYYLNHTNLYDFESFITFAIKNKFNLKIANDKNINALMFLSQNNEILSNEIIKSLIVDIDNAASERDKDNNIEEGDTALMIAIRNSNDIVKALIELGADINLSNKFDECPLSIAKGLGNTEIVNLLISKKSIDSYPEEDWVLKALFELRENEDEKLLQVENSETTEFTATVDNKEYIIFKTEEDAKTEAISKVKNDLENEPEIFTQSWLSNFYSVSDTDKRITSDEQADNYVDDIEDERVVEEAEIYDKDEWNELEDEELKEKQLEESKEKLKDNIRTEWYNGLDNDPVDFLVNVQGLYSSENIKDVSFLSIDTDKAAPDAVDTDGIAHFLAGYDNKEINLSNDVVAYRRN